MSFPSSADAALPTPALPPPDSLAIHLDLVGGISGDMFVAAMADALPELASHVMAEVDKVRAGDDGSAGFFEAASGGLRARRFGLVARPRSAARKAHGIEVRRANRHEPERDHGHENAHAGTAYATLRGRIEAAPLTAPTRKHALALLALLGDAEARVHGIPVEDVHFHELADWDSLLDVVAAGCIAGLLEGARWSATSLPLGGGTVSTAHGVLPVPAPATTLLLAGYPWHDDGIGGERVTPTGAAILRHLASPEDCNARRDTGRLFRAGSGAGTRVLPGMPNIVRAVVIERARAAAGDIDVVSVVEFDVDDMTGEEIAVAADRLRAESGVLDVSVGTRHGKKGRPLTEFRILARPEGADAVAQACFTETSTLGLRWREERRRVLHRTEVAATLADADVSVKVALRPGGKRTGKAAHDDVAATRGLAARRERRYEAVKSALKDSGE